MAVLRCGELRQRHGAKRERETPVPSASFAIYRAPAMRLGGKSDGIGAVRRAERPVEQTVEWLGNDRVGVRGIARDHSGKANAEEVV
jgi:hypothetical protein